MSSLNWILVVVFGTLGAVSLSSGTQFGRCNETYFVTRALGCETSFYRALANDDSTNCSSLYQSQVVQCYNYTLITCFRETRVGWRGIIQLALLMLEVMGSAQFYCSDVELDHLSRLPSHLRKLIPCEDEYLIAGERCSAKFREILASDRKAPELCKEYANSQACASAAAKAHCNTTFKISASLTQDNPFCDRKETRGSSTSKDPESPKLALVKENKNEITGTPEVEALSSKSPRSKAGYLASGITPIVLLWVTCVLWSCFYC